MRMLALTLLFVGCTHAKVQFNSDLDLTKAQYMPCLYVPGYTLTCTTPEQFEKVQLESKP